MLVIDHPYGADTWDNTPHHRSFTAAMAHSAVEGLEQAGHSVDLVDLHADDFNPVMSEQDLVAWRSGRRSSDPVVADYQSRLLAADHLVLAFPIWWEAMPATMKGFIDKVVSKNVCYGKGSGIHPMSNLTKLGGVTLLTVMSTPTLLYRVLFSSANTKIALRGTFGKIGVKNLSWVGHGGIDRSTEQSRARMLRRVEQRFAGLT